MKKALLLCACLFSLNATAESSKNNNYSTYGIAALNCAGLQELRKISKNSNLDAAVLGTLQGFMTAMSYERNIDLPELPMKEIKKVLYTSCDDNPTEPVRNFLIVTAEYFIKNSKNPG